MTELNWNGIESKGGHICAVFIHLNYYEAVRSHLLDSAIGSGSVDKYCEASLV